MKTRGTPILKVGLEDYNEALALGTIQTALNKTLREALAFHAEKSAKTQDKINAMWARMRQKYGLPDKPGLGVELIDGQAYVVDPTP